MLGERRGDDAPPRHPSTPIATIPLNCPRIPWNCLGHHVFSNPFPRRTMVASTFLANAAIASVKVRYDMSLFNEEELASQSLRRT